MLHTIAVLELLKKLARSSIENPCNSVDPAADNERVIITGGDTEVEAFAPFFDAEAERLHLLHGGKPVLIHPIV